MSNPLPQMLCLHGSGSSGAIFEAQTRGICSALRGRFTFVFVDASIISKAGPGVLPYFENSGPYYRWFADDFAAKDVQNQEFEAVTKSIHQGLAKQGKKASDMACVMGFSEGAMMACLLLHLAKRGDPRWAGLQFGTLICGVARDDILAAMGHDLHMPSIHCCGLFDQYVTASMKLTKCFDSESRAIMEFQGGHHVPARFDEIARLAVLMIKFGEEKPIMGRKWHSREV